MVKAASLFKSLQAGETKYLGKRKISKIDSYLSRLYLKQQTIKRSRSYIALILTNLANYIDAVGR